MARSREKPALRPVGRHELARALGDPRLLRRVDRLELVRHPVEPLGERLELVAGPNVDAPVERALAQRARASIDRIGRTMRRASRTLVAIAHATPTTISSAEVARAANTGRRASERDYPAKLAPPSARIGEQPRQETYAEYLASLESNADVRIRQDQSGEPREEVTPPSPLPPGSPFVASNASRPAADCAASPVAAQCPHGAAVAGVRLSAPRSGAKTWGSACAPA